ncbi:MAG: Sensor histidine kinase RcsC [bacterium]|nr:Sensor histidine kinase RcsC [bacterium]
MKDFARGSARPPDIVIVLIVVLLRLSLPTSQLVAQTDHLRFEPLTIDDGLSQNLVYSILQDRKGFMWFGTKDGLNRYDGYRFTVFRHDPYDSISISGNEVRVLFEDRAGTLWIGATGLNRFDPGTETFSRYLHGAAAPNSLSHNDVRALAEDHTGALWIGTTDGLNRLAPERAGSFTRYFHDPDNQQSLSHNQITALLVDRRGTLWIGTPQGLNALPSGSTSVFIRYHLNDDFVNYLYEDRQGLLWAGTASGLFRLDPRGDGAQTFQHYSLLSAPHLLRWEKSITAIQERPDGKFWVGTYTGLVVFDPQTGTSYSIRHDPRDPHSLSFDVILSVCQDRGGVVWFGTSGRGLNKLNLYAKPFHHYGGKGQRFSELSGFSVKAILEDQSGALWIVANDRVYQLDRAANQWQRFQAVALPVGSIIEEPQGVLWFHSGSGFFRFDPRGKRMSFVQSGLGNEDNFTVITVDGVRNSVARVTGLLARARSLNLKGIFVHRIYRDAGGVFWLASDAGLVRLNPADSSARHYRNDPRNPSSLSYDVVYSILPDPRDPDRFLWLGTAGGGLNRLEIATEKFTHYTEKDGLPNNVVYGILPDRHGRLWMSTNRGLSVFDPQTKTFRNFDVRDGLQSNEFNRNAYFLSRKGEMFFGGINGLNAFYPDSIRDNPNAPSLVITDFQLAYQSVSFRDPDSPLQQPISETGELRLAYDQNTIAFEFAAMDFTEPTKNQYAYKLENFNPQWVPAGTNRRATYTNLAPGRYVFRVKGANSDGAWNETGASLRIKIAPPFWKTWWAYACYVIFALAALIGLVKGRVRHFEKRTRELETAVQERTAEVVAHEKQLAVQAEKLQELDRIKSSFFANISHEFRTPLTLILGPVQRLLNEAAEVGAKHELRRIQKNAQRLLSLVNQLLDLSKLETGKMTVQVSRGNIVPLLRSIAMTFASLAEQKHLTLRFHSDADEIVLYFDRDKIEKIFYNLLSNAFKFTPAGGSVIVECGLSIADFGLRNAEQPIRESSAIPNPQSAIISVSDTGIGIPADRLPHIFDRFYQADHSSTRDYEGTGIGLSLVQELVALHHGSVEVVSVEGKGSAFTVRLPMGRAAYREDEILEPAMPLRATGDTFASEAMADVETPFSEPAAAPAQSEGPVVAMETIVLVVEDHAEVRAYIREYLEASYKVMEAADGAEGLEKAREVIPDLIVGDVMMPKMDGYEMCRALKTDEKTSHIPVILLTARAALEDKVAGLKTGADDYLTKPFEAAELLARVENLIASRRKLRERWKRAVVLKPGEIATTPLDQAFLEKALAVAEKNLEDEEFSIEEFAEQVGMSRSQLHRKLHALTNQSASLFLRSVRLQRAAELLCRHAGTVAEIAYQVGFSSQAYFTRCFHEHFGCSPKEYAQKTDAGNWSL